MNGDAPENGTFYSHFLLLNGYAPEKSPIVGLFVHFYRLLWTNGHQKGASLPLLGAGCTSGMLNGDAPEYVVVYSTKYFEQWKGHDGALNPDIIVTYSLENFIKGKDEALEIVER